MKKMKTKAAVLYETGSPLKIEELEIPELSDEQVLVQILYSGVCHSQINEVKALKGEDKYLPHTLGHEASAIVKQVGKKITKVSEGDYVVVSWIKGSGLDSAGIHYLKENKKINAGAVATFTQYAIVAENRLNKISKEIPSDIAVLFGCALLTGGGIIKNEIKPEKGTKIAIFGIGGVGAGCLTVASSMECFSEIIAVDIYDKKLEFAKEIGATKTINALNKKASEEIMKLTGNLGVDYAVETAGAKQAMEEAFNSIKSGTEGKKGGLAIIAGNISKSKTIEIQPFDLIKGKRIKGTWGGASNPDEDIRFYEKLYLEGKLKLDKLITHRYSLDQINNALEEKKKGEVCRAVIKLN